MSFSFIHILYYHPYLVSLATATVMLQYFAYKSSQQLHVGLGERLLAGVVIMNFE